MITILTKTNPLVIKVVQQGKDNVSRYRKRVLAHVELPKRESVAKVKVIEGFAKDVHKEFLRQEKALFRWLGKNSILRNLENWSRKELPDLYQKNFRFYDIDIGKAISASQRAILDKYIKGWAKNVKPEKMEKVFEEWYPKALNMGGQGALDDLGIALVFHLKDPAMLAEFVERGTKVTGWVTQKTLDDFRNILYKSYMEEGISPYEVRKRIKNLFEETYKNRAMTIARTETGTASSYAQHKTYKKNGIKFKMWLALVDQRTRESHEYANGQVVKINEMFDVMGVGMMHPFDSNAPSSETINCRCDEEAIIEGWTAPEKPWVGEE